MGTSAASQLSPWKQQHLGGSSSPHHSLPGFSSSLSSRFSVIAVPTLTDGLLAECYRLTWLSFPCGSCQDYRGQALVPCPDQLLVCWSTTVRQLKFFILSPMRMARFIIQCLPALENNWKFSTRPEDDLSVRFRRPRQIIPLSWIPLDRAA